MAAYFKRIIILNFLFCRVALSASNCPEWILKKSEVPLCPKDAKILPETYPSAAVLVSDKSLYGPELVQSTVKKIVDAAEDKMPLILFATKRETYDQVKDYISRLSYSDPTQRKRILDSLVLYESEDRLTYQQDYFESFNNNGKVILKNFSGYRGSKNSFQKLIDTLKPCGFEAGDDLSVPITKISFLNEAVTSIMGEASAYMGGNVEGLPGGLCLLGSSGEDIRSTKYDQFKKKVCGNSSAKVLVVNTDWLKIGHVDEIVKVVPNKRKEEPCDFSIVVSSPAKALELLEKYPNDKFIDAGLSDKEISSNEFLVGLCSAYKRLPSENRNSIRRVKGVAWFLMYGSLPAEANDEPRYGCRSLTNAQALKALRSENSDLYNQRINIELQKTKQQIVSKIRLNLPQCEVDFIDAPNLYFGGSVFDYRASLLGADIDPGLPPVDYGEKIENIEHRFSLPLRWAKSALPATTNSISIHSTVISPDPVNETFRNYLDKQYNDRGLKSKYVDTFTFNAQGNGNLHCLTKTIPICR